MASSEVEVARPILAEVAAQIADVQVRNRGTIGGNVCSNDPTNHLPPLLVALGASMTIRGADGERTVPAEEFFLGVYLTAVGEGELLLSVSVPAAAKAARRLRVDHDRPRRHVHRERRREPLRRRDADRARLRRRRADPGHSGRRATRRAVREAVAGARARASVGRARLRRLPPPSRRASARCAPSSRPAERGR